MPNLDNTETKMALASLFGMPLDDLGRDIDATCPKLIEILAAEFESPQAAMVCLAVFYIGMACKAMKDPEVNPIEWAHELIDTVGVLMTVGTFNYEGMGR